MGISAKLYDKDFYAWTQETVKALKNKSFDQVDLEHLIEEIEGMSARDLREIRSRLIILIAHLLKWEFQSENRSSSWTGTIVEQRDQLQTLLEQSPSLKTKLTLAINDPKIYKKALSIAVAETEINKNAFPNMLHYTVNQLLDDEFYP